MDVPDMAVRAWRTVLEMLHDRTVFVDDVAASVTALTVPGMGDNEIHGLATETQTFAVAVITSETPRPDQALEQSGGARNRALPRAASRPAAAAPQPEAADDDAVDEDEVEDEEALKVDAAAQQAPTDSLDSRDARLAKHVVVFHTADQTLKKEELLSLVDDAAVILLIISSVPSGASRKSLEAAAAANGSRIEFFTLREMQYNVTRHVCVPRHALMTPAQEEDAVRRFRLTSRFQFHIILTSDPVARYLGLRHGNIVKIERYSPTSGTSINYRCCRSVASGSYVAPPS